MFKHAETPFCMCMKFVYVCEKTDDAFFVFDFAQLIALRLGGDVVPNSVYFSVVRSYILLLG